MVDHIQNVTSKIRSHSCAISQRIKGQTWTLCDFSPVVTVLHNILIFQNAIARTLNFDQVKGVIVKLYSAIPPSAYYDNK